MGKSIDDPSVNQYLKNHFVKLVADEARNGIKFDLGFNNSTLEFSVEEILAMNLNEIKSRALNDLEANPHAAALVEDVAVSIPPLRPKLSDKLIWTPWRWPTFPMFWD